MKKIYILADSCDREIVLTKYDTYKEAYNTMKAELDHVLGFDSLDVDAEIESGYARGEDYDIHTWSAWSNVKNTNNDWVIDFFEV